MSDRTAELYSAEREAALVRENQAKAQWSTDRMKAQVERAEAERVEAVADKIHTSIASLFFLQRELAVIEPEYTRLLKLNGSGDYFMDPQKPARLFFVRQEITRLDAYLRSVTDFNSQEILDATEKFSHSQGAPERLAKAASAAAKKIEADAKPQVSQSGPAVTYSCEKCGADLSNPSLPLHLNGNHTWCVRNVRKAFSTGRSAMWLLSEGNVTVEELQQAGIPVPEL